jgi:hypothetical protein
MLEGLGGVFQGHEFGALDVELEEVHGAAEVEVVEALGLDGDFFVDDHEFGEIDEEGVRGAIGFKKGGGHRKIGDMEGVCGSIADGVGQVADAFGDGGGEGVEFVAFLGDGFEADEFGATEAAEVDPGIAGLAADGESADIDATDFVAELEKIKKGVGGHVGMRMGRRRRLFCFAFGREWFISNARCHKPRIFQDPPETRCQKFFCRWRAG